MVLLRHSKYRSSMGSLMGVSEIIEAPESSIIGKHSGTRCQLNSASGNRNKKLPVLKLGCKDSLEDDIDKLLESIRTPLKGSFQSQNAKNVQKNPITVDVIRSPRIVNSETVNLKQALRDLCISKASEMAAMKRLSKSKYTSAGSEAGRIMTLYNSIAGEASGLGASFVGDKESVVQISPVSEEIKWHSSRSLTSSLPSAKMTSLSQNTNSSTEVSSVVTESESGTELQKEPIYECREALVQTTKLEMEKKTSVPAPSSNVDDSMLDQTENAPITSKSAGKTTIQKSRRRGKWQTMSSALSSIPNGDKLSKPQKTHRLVKPVLRNKNLNKKKTKQNSGSTTSCEKKITDGSLEPSTSKLVCERCHCAVENMKTEENHESEISSHHISSKNGGSSSNVQALGPKPIVASTTCSRSGAVGKGRTLQFRENSVLSQSSKSSPGEHSSSTITSYESNGLGCWNRPHMSKDVRWEAICQVQMQHGLLSLKHFNLLKKLGSGDIGTVYLAELIGTNCLFAIKVMDNEFLARRKKMPRAQTEREILNMLDHPFLPTLYSQFTSDNLSCLVMEYCPGGDLHVLRQRQLGRSFSEPAARFYVAEVLLALEYLHMLGVVYRDLKPENILVREDGHIMLTDFDLSLRCNVNPTLLKLSGDVDPTRISHPCSAPFCIEPLCIEPSCQVPCFSPKFPPASAKHRKPKPDLSTQVRALPQLVAEPTDARSNSFVGTHEYLAPEIIKGEGHGAAVDWWTFGIFLYELLYGRTPFKGSNNEETLVNIVLKSLKFPDSPFVSFQARDLIGGLLVKEPENRLGTEKGAAEIKQHPFFEGLNWALIRCAVPPEIPESLDLGFSDHISEGNNNYFEFELF